MPTAALRTGVDMPAAVLRTGVALLLCGAASGCQTTPPTAAADGVPAPSATAAAEKFRSDRSYKAVAPPTRLRIPAARIDTPLQQRGRAADGTIEVPTRPDIAGWYAEGPRPGQAGPAVLLGHVDSRTGPGVFIHLEELKVGAPVYIERADGSTVTFRVTGTQRVPKDRFPTELVYAPTLEPTLRMVTCGGSFDSTQGHYRENVIVLATP